MTNCNYSHDNDSTTVFLKQGDRISVIKNTTSTPVSEYNKAHFVLVKI